MPLSSTTRIAQAPDVIVRGFARESVILNLKTDSCLGLDEVGSRFWHVLMESGSIKQTRQRLLIEYDVDSTELERDLEDFVGRLLEHKLIVTLGEPE